MTRGHERGHPRHHHDRRDHDVSLLGTRVIKIVNNIGVSVELVAVALMVVLFLFHAKRGPGVVMQTNGTSAGYHAGYLGSLARISPARPVHHVGIRYRRIRRRGNRQSS